MEPGSCPASPLHLELVVEGSCSNRLQGLMLAPPGMEQDGNLDFQTRSLLLLSLVPEM